MRNHLVLAVTLMVGCLGGAAATRVIAPSARAQPVGTRFEYKCPEDADTSRLNKLGEEGWELVSVAVQRPAAFGGDASDAHLQYCLKRARP